MSLDTRVKHEYDLLKNDEHKYDLLENDKYVHKLLGKTRELRYFNTLHNEEGFGAGKVFPYLSSPLWPNLLINLFSLTRRSLDLACRLGAMTFSLLSPSGSFSLLSPSGSFSLLSPSGLTRGSMDTRVKHKYDLLKNDEHKYDLLENDKYVHKLLGKTRELRYFNTLHNEEGFGAGKVFPYLSSPLWPNLLINLFSLTRRSLDLACRLGAMTFSLLSPSGFLLFPSPSGSFSLLSPSGLTRGSMDTRVKHEYDLLKNDEHKYDLLENDKYVHKLLGKTRELRYFNTLHNEEGFGAGKVFPYLSSPLLPLTGENKLII